MNGILNPGFEVTLKKSKDGKETIEGADMFNGHKMYAVAYSNGTTINNDAVTVQLWDKATPDDKSNILVLDTKAVVGENDKSGVMVLSNGLQRKRLIKMPLVIRTINHTSNSLIA